MLGTWLWHFIVHVTGPAKITRISTRTKIQFIDGYYSYTCDLPFHASKTASQVYTYPDGEFLALQNTYQIHNLGTV